jgi:cyclophilin family peptidyl-prolyl cis-trans isomerase
VGPVLLLSLVLTTFVQAAPRQAPPPPTPAAGNPTAIISTSLGDITIELFKDRAPVSVANFLQYVKDDHYSGTLFHRVVSGLVIQGGGYDETMTEKPTRAPILNEATNGLRNLTGTVAMARTRALRSATSQFYVNLADNREFDHRGFTPSDFGYAVFGRVIAGMDVVAKIGAVATRAAGGMESVPVEPVVIKGVTVK